MTDPVERAMDRIAAVGSLMVYPGRVLKRLHQISGLGGRGVFDEIHATPEGYVDLLSLAEMVSIEKYGLQVKQVPGELGSIMGIPVKVVQTSLPCKVVLVRTTGEQFALL